MKLEYKIIAGAGIFIIVLYLAYWFLSYEDAGSVMLLFGGCAYLMLGSFLFLQWRRRRGHLRPEDNPQAEQEDGEGEIAFFPAASVWPAGIALGAILVAIGLIWGNWWIVLGLPIMMGAIIGFSVEAEAGFDAVEEAQAAARATAAPLEDAHGEGAHGEGAHRTSSSSTSPSS